MLVIDPEPVRLMRATEQREAAKIKGQIKRLRKQLSNRQERIAILDDVLQCCHQADPRTLTVMSSNRASSATMVARCRAVISVLDTHGDMSPRDLLPKVGDELEAPLLPHQLRAVLRKYSNVFERRVGRHGVWGLKRVS